MVTPEIEHCSECGNAMDVTKFAPYSEVQCPACEKNVHVKSEVGGYAITGTQGVGGMSLVFKAVDKTLGRKVAIKLLNESYSSDAKRIEEFEKEAKITAAISHPNVVRVFTVGQAYGRYFIAMELVEGQSLEQRITTDGKLDEQSVVRLAIEVAEGLKAAHAAGLIHRDMKPGNILIDANGRAKIVDFGLALVTSGGKAIAEEIWATPFYVPPETLKQEEEDLRSDIYALAASLYHALAGEPPFTTETKSTSELLRIKTEIPPLAKKAEGGSPQICAVIDKAMAFQAEERFQSYEELLKALKQLELFYKNGTDPDRLDGVPIKDKKGTPLIPIAAVSICVLAGGIWFFSQSDEKSVEDSRAVEIAQTVEVVKDEGTEQRQFIAGELRKAQELLKGDEFASASDTYRDLALTRGVPRETLIWAGTNAAATAFLDGDSESAKEVLRAVRSRLAKQDDLLESDRQLLSAFYQLEGFEKIEIPDKLSKTLNDLLSFTSALKEWEQGNWVDANEMFVALGDAGAYTDFIERYLADFVALESFQNGVEVADVEEAEELLDLLEQRSAELKTKGRAPFNVTQWKKQIIHQREMVELEAKRLVEKQAKAEMLANSAWLSAEEDSKEALKKFQFKRAAKLLNEAVPLSDAQKKWRESVLFFAKPAANLYDSSAVIFADKKSDFVVLHKDDVAEYDTLLGADDDGLRVSAGGKKENLKWSKVSPYSIWELHKSVPNNSVPAELRDARLLQLACYTYLTGLKEQSLMLVNKLSEADPSFGESWRANAALFEASSSDGVQAN